MSADILAVVRDRATAKIKATKSEISIDPATWLAIFTALVQLLQSCGKKDKDKTRLANSLRKPTVMQQIATRRAIISELGRPAFRKHGDTIVTQLFEVGAEASPEEAAAFVAQVVPDSK
jgi:hypothetical protein